jgi:hypothetical protein
LARNILPTHADVIRHYLFIRDFQLKDSKASVKIIVKETTSVIISIWKMASLPILSNERVEKKIADYKEKYSLLLNCFNDRIKNDSYKSKIKSFQEEGELQLFDICTCKCSDFNKCRCERSRKVPINERIFLNDQRNSRYMIIGAVDPVRSRLTWQNEERKSLALERQSKNANPSYFSQNSSLLDRLDCSNGKSPSTSTLNRSVSKQMRTELPRLAMEADRYHLSDRVTASIATAVLSDLSVVTKEDQSMIIDKNKVRRSREKNRANLKSNSSCLLEALYFDGRKDSTLVQNKIDGRYHQFQQIEEHYVLIGEPDSVYIGHITPISGKAESICGSIIEFFQNENISLDNLIAIGCDGTNVNVGVNNGIIRRLELQLERPLQWIVCLFHCNELLLRHLFIDLDGTTNSPNTYSGIIGKAIERSEHLPVCGFERIILPDLEGIAYLTDLSTDQQLLLDFSIAISRGLCSIPLANN